MSDVIYRWAVLFFLGAILSASFQKQAPPTATEPAADPYWYCFYHVDPLPGTKRGDKEERDSYTRALCYATAQRCETARLGAEADERQKELTDIYYFHISLESTGELHDRPFAFVGGTCSQRRVACCARITPQFRWGDNNYVCFAPKTAGACREKNEEERKDPEWGLTFVEWEPGVLFKEVRVTAIPGAY